MRIFKDSTGRDWTISITADDLFIIRETCDVDLSKFMQPSEMEKLQDFFIAMKILHQLCSKQASQLGLDRAGFFGLLSGDYLDDAVIAFHDELLFFSRNKRNATILDKLKAKDEEVRAKLLDRMDKEIQGMDASQIVEQIATGSMKSSTPTAASSE